MSASYATSDLRIRVAIYGPENWRTVVQDEPGALWDITGPPYPTKQAALAAVDSVLCDYFGELPTRAELAQRIDRALAVIRAGSSYKLAERVTALLAGENRHVTPPWLHERNEDSYGTGNGHPFWETVTYRDSGMWRLFERDGWTYAYDRQHNGWWHFPTAAEGDAHAREHERGLDMHA